MAGLSIALHLSPASSLVNPVRKFLHALFIEQLHDPELASQAMLAVHELLENAIQYSTDGNAMVRVVVGEQGEIEISVENQGLIEHAPALFAQVAAANEADDPMDFMMKKMEASIHDGGRKVGLGLARIRTESRLELDCDVTDEGLIRITASRGANR
jgi:hypothetical protein